MSKSIKIHKIPQKNPSRGWYLMMFSWSCSEMVTSWSLCNYICKPFLDISLSCCVYPVFSLEHWHQAHHFQILSFTLALNSGGGYGRNFPLFAAGQPRGTGLSAKIHGESFAFTIRQFFRNAKINQLQVALRIQHHLGAKKDKTALQ